MGVTKLRAQAVIDPDKAREEIRKIGKECNYTTKGLAQAFNVSYPTMLRILTQLGMRKEVRESWKAAKCDQKKSS